MVQDKHCLSADRTEYERQMDHFKKANWQTFMKESDRQLNEVSEELSIEVLDSKNKAS